jgi:hypothetical protein
VEVECARLVVLRCGVLVVESPGDGGGGLGSSCSQGAMLAPARLPCLPCDSMAEGSRMPSMSLSSTVLPNPSALPSRPGYSSSRTRAASGTFGLACKLADGLPPGDLRDFGLALPCRWLCIDA